MMLHPGLELTAIFSSFQASYTEALVFWHVNNNTKERIFLADNALFFLHIKVMLFRKT